MSQTTDQLSFSFTSTERRKGEALVDAVALSSASDTFVTAFVRTSSPGRVTLVASEVTDSSIAAKCSCAVAKKDQLCRHIWATLLRLEDKKHDFLLGKDSISLEIESSSEGFKDESADETSQSEIEISRRERQDEFKARQKALAKEYRRQRSEKQKELRKQNKARAKTESHTASASLEASADRQPSNGRKARTPAFNYPSAVEEARRYFQQNGFEMNQPLELSEIIDAKKQLSRVFHPDKGGSHDEILELNRNFQIISDYLKS